MAQPTDQFPVYVAHMPSCAKKWPEKEVRLLSHAHPLGTVAKEPLQFGFADGFMGLVLCLLSGFHVFAKYSKLYFRNF